MRHIGSYLPRNHAPLQDQPLHVGRFGRPFSINTIKKGKIHELAKP